MTDLFLVIKELANMAVTKLEGQEWKGSTYINRLNLAILFK